MRKYEDGDNAENGRLIQVLCNQCKRELKVSNGYLKEGCFVVDASFGYFSKRDGVRHRFDLCEECYDKMIARFQIPVDESAVRELL